MLFAAIGASGAVGWPLSSFALLKSQARAGGGGRPEISSHTPPRLVCAAALLCPLLERETPLTDLSLTDGRLHTPHAHRPFVIFNIQDFLSRHETRRSRPLSSARRARARASFRPIEIALFYSSAPSAPRAAGPLCSGDQDSGERGPRGRGTVHTGDGPPRREAADSSRRETTSICPQHGLRIYFTTYTQCLRERQGIKIGISGARDPASSTAPCPIVRLPGRRR